MPRIFPPMHPDRDAASGHALLTVEQIDDIVHVRLARPRKRNAINDQLLGEIHAVFADLPRSARVAVISGDGSHFCAGLDLSEAVDRDLGGAIHHSRAWHAAFEQIQFGRVPVVAVLSGATIGGGMELAAAAHIRVADRSAFYALPEGQRGIFVGGGGSSRIPRLIGVSAMTDLMLTGRVMNAEEGQARGYSSYLVETGEALPQALQIARRIAANAELSNFAVVHALPRIAGMHPADGLFTEALISSIALSGDEAKERMTAFLEKRAAGFRPL